MFAAALAAQNSDYKKSEFSAGYSLVGLDSGGVDRQGLNGFEVSGVYNFSRYFGVKGDFSAAFRSSHVGFTIPPGNTVTFDIHQRLFNFLGGIQVKDNSNTGRLKPFAHALVGVGQNRSASENFQCTAPCAGFIGGSSTTTGFAGAFGGGLDIRVNNRFQVRVLQVDYNPVRAFDQTQHNIRLGAGIVF